MSGRRARLVRLAYAIDRMMDAHGNTVCDYRMSARLARRFPVLRRNVLALALGPSSLYPDRVRPAWLTLRRDRRHDGQAPDAG